MPLFNATNQVEVGLATRVEHYDRVFDNTLGLYAGEMSMENQAALDFIFALSSSQLGRLAGVANKVPRLNSAGTAWYMSSMAGALFMLSGDALDGDAEEGAEHGQQYREFSDVSLTYAEWFSYYQFDSANIEVVLVWRIAGDAPSPGDKVRWQAKFERQNAGFNNGSDSYATAQAVSSIALDGLTEGQTVYTTIPFTSAQIDGLVTGEAFRLRVERDPTHGDDTYGSPALLAMVILREA